MNIAQYLKGSKMILSQSRKVSILIKEFFVYVIFILLDFILKTLEALFNSRGTYGMYSQFSFHLFLISS